MKIITNNIIVVVCACICWTAVTEAQKNPGLNDSPFDGSVALPKNAVQRRNNKQVANFPSGFVTTKRSVETPPLATSLGPNQKGDDIFVTEYVSVASGNNIGTVFPSNLAQIGASLLKPSGGSPIFFQDVSRPLLGTIFYTAGDLYNSVELIDISDFTKQDVQQALKDEREIPFDPSLVDPKPIGNRAIRKRFGKDVLEPPGPTTGFTFNGQCTVVSDRVKTTGNQKAFDEQKLFAEIDGHTCLYDLCLESQSLQFGGCILIYSGTAFTFDIRSNELPPAFPGFIVGATGVYKGIRGTADILTLTGRTPINKDVSVEDLIGDSTAFPGPENQNNTQTFFPEQLGEIVTKIFLITNQKLAPVGLD